MVFRQAVEMIRGASGGLLLAALLVWPGVADPSSGWVEEMGSQGGTMVALDLMDLDIPGEGSGDQMDLPPLKVPEREGGVAAPSVPRREPVGVESSKAEAPVPAKPAPSRLPGMAPFILEGAGSGDQMDLPPLKAPEREGGVAASSPSTREGAGIESRKAETPARVEPASAPWPAKGPVVLEGAGREGRRGKAGSKPAKQPKTEALVKETPADLQSPPSPRSGVESLKAPSTANVQGLGEPTTPEIPLLIDRGSGTENSLDSGEVSPLRMKPVTDLYEGPEARQPSPSPSKSPGPVDYLQVREEIDSGLIEIYKRFYEGR